MTIATMTCFIAFKCDHIKQNSVKKRFCVSYPYFVFYFEKSDKNGRNNRILST